MALQPACFGGAFGSLPAGSGGLGSGVVGGIWEAHAVDTATIVVSTIPQPAALLNPAVWSVVPVGPGAPVTVISVVQLVPGTQWQLTVDPGLSPGGLDYQVTLDYVAAGSVMDPGCASITIESPLSALLVEHCEGGAFGSAPFGSGGLGSGFLGGLYTSAILDANTIDVFTIPLPPWLMLQPALWAVTPLGAQSPVAVAGVVEVAAGTQWRLTVAPELEGGPYLVTFDPDPVYAGHLISTSCRALTIDFEEPGNVVPEPAVPFAEEPYDIASPNLVRDAGLVDPPPLGQYQINDRGDFALDSRLQGLRKRILRRASTALGGFVLLPGYGFAQKLKGAIRPAMLSDLAADAQAQVLREPEVIRAQVFMQQLRSQPNVVVQTIRARTVNGLDVVASQQIDLRPKG